MFKSNTKTLKLKRKKTMQFAMFLTILFIGLKLTDHIDWSWFLVLSPMPISILIGLITLFTSFKLQKK